MVKLRDILEVLRECMIYREKKCMGIAQNVSELLALQIIFHTIF